MSINDKKNNICYRRKDLYRMSKDSQKVKENEIRRKMNRRLECEIQRDTYKKFKWLHMRNEAFRLPTSTMESLLSRWHIRKPRKARKFSRKRSAIRDWRQTNFKISNVCMLKSKE